LDGAPFRAFEKMRESLVLEDAYVYPGPIQYFGPSKITDITTLTLHLES
jgi:pyrophosphate--fructose-6-phosphate 1-phosphotransferase